MTWLCNLPLPLCLWTTNDDRDDGSSSSVISIVSQGCVAVVSQEITCSRGMPHWSKESTVYGLINVICICGIKLILIRGRLSTLGDFLSFPSHPSPIKWSLDDIHLARENKASYHSVCVQWEGILQGCLDSVWKRDVMQRIKARGSLCQALGWAYNGPAVMLFGSGSQPNSKFQVNNNVWICRNQVQSLRGAQRAFCFAFLGCSQGF